MNRPAHPGRPMLPGESGCGADPGRGLDPGRLHPEHVWEQRRALGRRLAALRSRSGFSQWEFAPLTGYSRSTLSDAELGRHRLRREFWERCDGALASEGMLTAAYDQIEMQATAVRRSARRQAQAAREEQASRRLQALVPARPEAPVAPAGAPDGISWGRTASAVPADAATARAAQADPSTLAVMEQCPHCHQPITVLIVAAAAPASGDSPG